MFSCRKKKRKNKKNHKFLNRVKGQMELIKKKKIKLSKVYCFVRNLANKLASFLLG